MWTQRGCRVRPLLFELTQRTTEVKRMLTALIQKLTADR
jgi:hypothetical protein